MEDSTINYYDWSQPVHSDLTLTAVWDENIDPNNPTWEYLRMAAGKEHPEDWYPLGTELTSSSFLGITQWEVVHYGECEIINKETQEVETVRGAYVTTKYQATASGLGNGADLMAWKLWWQNNSKNLPAEIKELAATVNDSEVGGLQMFPLKYENVVPVEANDATIWPYYNVELATWRTRMPRNASTLYPGTQYSMIYLFITRGSSWSEWNTASYATNNVEPTTFPTLKTINVFSYSNSGYSPNIKPCVFIPA